MCKNALRINHILFADDSILFYKADVEENRRIQHIIVKYEKVSGQQLNKAKTSILFSNNVTTNTKEQLRALWRVNGT